MRRIVAIVLVLLSAAFFGSRLTFGIDGGGGVEKNCKDLGTYCLKSETGCVAVEWDAFPVCEIKCVNGSVKDCFPPPPIQE